MDMAPVLLLILGILAPVQDPADDRYNFLVGLAEKGLHDLAAKEAEGFLEEFPRHPKASLARYRLANARYELGEIGPAAANYTALAARTAFEFRAESAFRAGQCQLDLAQYADAELALGLVLKLDKDYLKVPATFLLGEAAFRQGRFDDAEKRYLEVLDKDAEGVYAKDSLYGAAWCAFRQGHSDDAVQRIGAFVAANPRDELVPEMHFLAGEAHLEVGRAKEALVDYRQVKSGEFADAALRGAGFALAELEDHPAAAREFATLVERHPTSPYLAEALLQQGVHLLKAGDSRAALVPLTAQAAGDGAEVLYWRAQALSGTGEKEQAIAAVDRALAGRADADLQERLRVLRGDLLFELGRLDEAVGSYGGSGSDYALHAAGIASLNQSRHREAASLSRQLLEKYPDSAYTGHAWLTLGEAELALEKYAEAEQAFLQAEKFEVEDQARAARILSRRGWCRYLLDDPAAAAPLFAQVAGRFPDAAEAEEAGFMAGRAREVADDPAGAVQAWRTYLQRHREGEHRPEALLRTSRLIGPADAIALLRMLVTESPDHDLAPQGLLELADLQHAEGDAKAAMASYRGLLARYPGTDPAPAAAYGLAWALRENGEPKEACEQLRAGLAMKGIDAELTLASLELLVWSEKDAGRPDQAVAAWKAYAQRAKDETARLETARVVVAALSAAERHAEAQTLLQEELRRVKDRSVASGLLVEQVYVSLDQGEVEQAEAQARAARRNAAADPAVAEAWFFVGEARFEAGELVKAAELYSIAAATPGSPVVDRALYKEGFCRLSSEDLAAAERAFRALVDGHAASPLRGEGLFLLGETLFRQGRFADALPPLETLRADFPRHETMPKALFRLGIAYCQVERFEDAESALTRLVQAHADFPNAVEAELWRGRALAANGKERDAAQAFSKVVARDRGVLAARARLET
ncbi:MAG TPA: tetratricopeptide repeat protein, partial [Planctomycetota bacterium]